MTICSKPILAMAMVGLLFSPAASIVEAQPRNLPRTDLWVTDNTVKTLAVECGKLYIGGTFNRVGPATGSVALLDPGNPAPQLPFPKIEGGDINAVAPDGVGGWYVGGNFSLVNGMSISRLAHIRSDHSVDLAWTPNPDSAVYAIVAASDRVYVGGAFQNLSGQPRSRIAAFSSSTGLLTNWSPIVGGVLPAVRCIEVIGSTVYVGGDFTTIDGQSRPRIGAINANASQAGSYFTSWNPVATNSVRTIARSASGNTFYVGGDFNGSASIGGANRNRIAEINITNAQATSWNPNANGSVRALTVAGDFVYAGGAFTTIGGTSRSGVAELNPVLITTYVTPWDPSPQPAGNVYSLASMNGVIYLGGDFTAVNGTARGRIVALNPNVSSNYLVNWNPDASGRVLSIAAAQGRLVAAGAFDSIGRLVRNNVAAISLDSGAATSWNPGTDGEVMAIAAYGNTVYIGGSFTSVGGQARNKFAALDANSGVPLAWNINPESYVSAIVPSADGSTVFVGGNFSTFGGFPRNRLAAIDTSNGGVTGWDPNSDSAVTALAMAEGTIIAGGGFTTIGLQAHRYIAALDTSTGSATGWSQEPNAAPHVVTDSGNTVYFGGEFTNFDGQTRNRIMSIDKVTGAVLPWDPNASAPVRALAVTSSAIYAGGDFTTIGGQQRNRLAAIDSSGIASPGWNPGANGTVYAVTTTNDAVIVGGAFTSIGTQQRRSLAAFTFTNSEWSGGAGLWDVPSNWDPPEVPNNFECETYNVHIGGATSNVSTNINPIINTIKIDTGATLSVDQGDLTIVTPDGIVNNSNFFVSNGHQIIASTSMPFTGTQPLQLVGAGIGSQNQSDLVSILTPISGFGNISAAFSNQSIIHANAPDQTLDLDGSFPGYNFGTLQATNNGILRLLRAVDGTGTLLAAGGSIQVLGNSSVIVSAKSLDVTDGGQGRVDGASQLSISTHVRASCTLGFRGCNPPVLNITATPQGGHGLTIGGNLELVGAVSLGVTLDASVALAGNFDNRCTTPITYNWDGGTLIMNGSAAQDIEAASIDYGDHNPVAYNNNFVIGTLQIEAGSVVDVRNSFENQSPGICEALYVDTLILGAGSTLRLHGCNVYFHHLQPGGTVDTSAGGQLRSALIGDLDCDGNVNGADIQSLVLILTDQAAYSLLHPNCDAMRADLDLNGLIDMNDVPRFLDILQ